MSEAVARGIAADPYGHMTPAVLAEIAWLQANGLRMLRRGTLFKALNAARWDKDGNWAGPLTPQRDVAAEIAELQDTERAHALDRRNARRRARQAEIAAAKAAARNALTGAPISIPDARAREYDFAAICARYPSCNWGVHEWFDALQEDDLLFAAILNGVAGMHSLRNKARAERQQARKTNGARASAPAISRKLVLA